MGDGAIPSNSSNPLLSRLDRLDFIMKYMERKTKFEGSESSDNISAFSGGELIRRSGCMPMDMALKETHLKGSLIDRVASLESRLFQLCLDMESSSTSRTSSSGTCSQTSGDSSSHRSRGESSSSSLPTFNINPNYGSSRISQLHVMSTTHEIEEKSDREEQNPPSTPPKQKLKKKNKPKKDGKSCKSEKKRTPPSWPLKLLGC
ncbi:hypothetical protein TorRG33x02_270620 [Trema orientale]|uniref:Uncharacterized protein n=1 Tax=Trema orientale TaxID=63057 RepID=A0A2P5CWV9_TREOI|nr:hypothetical protein TorRG33x02_270620 [Trema orientale]